MSKPVILTGLRANNDLHIGNYLGALLPMVDMAKKHAGEYQINLFVPDLHSFTAPSENVNRGSLQQAIMQNLRIFIAAGLPISNANVHIYRQSYIPAHSELTWILDCFTGFGEMSRMTQFKDKANDYLKDMLARLEIESKKTPEDDEDQIFESVYEAILQKYENNPSVYNDMDKIIVSALELRNKSLEEHLETLRKYRAALEESVSSSRTTIGLFNYPVLMAADILLYGAIYVPVGDDQRQHLEFTRDIATRMNKLFGELFVVPKSVKEQHRFFSKEQGLRIRDLQNPVKKMSKSDGGAGVLFLTDSHEVVIKKVMSAETDSFNHVRYDYEQQPGISNLLDMLKYLGGNPEEFLGQKQYGPLKTAVADAAVAFLGDFQARLAKVDDAAILQKLAASEKQMNEQANATLLKVQQAVGLRA